MNRSAHPISRILAFLIDYLMIYNTVFMILYFGFGISPMTSIRLSHVISTFYNILFVYYYNGQTIGKKISKLQVIQAGEKPSLMSISIREVAKLLYIIPVFGLIIIIVDVILLFMRRRLIHDLLSETFLIYNGTANA